MSRNRIRTAENIDQHIRPNLPNLKEGLFIFRYLKPYRVMFVAGLAFIVLSSLTTLSFPYLLKEMIDSAMASPQSPSRFSSRQVALILVGVLALQTIFSFMRILLFTTVGENALANLRQDIYGKLIRMPMGFFSQRRVGELTSRMTADVSQIQDALTVILAELIRGMLTLIVGLGLIFYLSSKLALLMLSVVPVIILLAARFGKKIRSYSRQAQDQLADTGTIVEETLQGIAGVKAFANEWFEMNRYRRSMKEVVRLLIRNGRFKGIFISILLFGVFGAIVLVVWYGAQLMQAGQISFGDLTAFVVYTAFVGGTMAGFADMFSHLQKTIGATQRVRELLREETEDLSFSPPSESRQLPRFSGRVVLDRLNFAYPHRPEIPVIRDLSLVAEPGEQIAIVGPSGAGKSTLVSLLLRFYTPQSGELILDGRSAREVPLNQWRSQMALVPQDVLLFGGSIEENIAYGKPGASREEVEEAARKANAHAFIQSFPQNYKTLVGDRGVKLSGGQRQRIAIARAILRDPAILILDEATSSLDSESELQVQEALNHLMEGRTSFVIAHRLSTIRHADKIIVMEHGRIREMGNHQELIQLPDGLYRSLHRLQMSGMEL